MSAFGGKADHINRANCAIAKDYSGTSCIDLDLIQRNVRTDGPSSLFKCEAFPPYWWHALRQAPGEVEQSSSWNRFVSYLRASRLRRKHQCQTEFCVLSATVKERAPVLLVVAPANGRSRAPTSATAKNVTAVANGVAMYVAGAVKSNHLPLSLRLLSMDCFIWKTLEDISQQTRQPLLQASRTGISRAVSVWKRKAVPGGKAAAQRSRALMRRSRAFDWHQFLISAYGPKRTFAFCGAHVGL